MINFKNNKKFKHVFPPLQVSPTRIKLIWEASIGSHFFSNVLIDYAVLGSDLLRGQLSICGPLYISLPIKPKPKSSQNFIQAKTQLSHVETSHLWQPFATV